MVMKVYQQKQLWQDIRRTRTAKGLTLDDLAKLIGYSNRSTINKIESGAYNIGHEKILKFAYLLKYQLDIFLLEKRIIKQIK